MIDRVEHERRELVTMHNQLSSLTFCSTCEQLVQKGLDYFSCSGRPLPALERHLAIELDEPIGSS